MKRVLLLIVVIIAGLAGLQPFARETSGAGALAGATPYLLPGRASATPRPGEPLAATAPQPPWTLPGTLAPTPHPDCAEVFPPDDVARIDFGMTTRPQLEATFGRAARVGGRPTTLRFAEAGCILAVTLGGDEAQTVELSDYGTLDWLLGHYGLPDGVGIAQGNLTLLQFDVAVLLYAEAGVVAIFDTLPSDLNRASPVATLHLRPPYDLDRQFRRLNLRWVEDWQPPLR